MKRKNELVVITKAKELCSYVMVVTQKSPKHFRYTFVSRMQNLSLDIIENLFRANDVFLNSPSNYQKRHEFQQAALTSVKLLSYISYLSFENGCILLKQFEQISKLSDDVQNLIGAWIQSDLKRMNNTGIAL